MKSSFKLLLGILFLGSAGIAMADDDHRDDHDRARVIVVPAHHYHHRRHHHPVVHSKVELKVGIGNDHH